MSLQVIHGLHAVHLMHQKMNEVITDEKTAWGNFLNILKNLVIKVINYEKKVMIPLTNYEKKSYEKPKVCYICKKKFCTDKNDEKKIKRKEKVRGNCHYTRKFRGAAHIICN